MGNRYQSPQNTKKIRLRRAKATKVTTICCFSGFVQKKRRPKGGENFWEQNFVDTSKTNIKTLFLDTFCLSYPTLSAVVFRFPRIWENVWLGGEFFLKNNIWAIGSVGISRINTPVQAPLYIARYITFFFAKFLKFSKRDI